MRNIDFNEVERICRLLEIYGSLLSDTQRSAVSMHFEDDYSLSEISELCGISRQGVQDAQKKGIAVLNDYEDKLHILSKSEKLSLTLNSIADKLENDENSRCECASLLRDIQI